MGREEIQAGQQKGFETLHFSHWHVFSFLTFSELFFFLSAHLFYVKRLICLSQLIGSASGFNHPDKSAPPKAEISE